jgi:hypothetical protein
MSFSPYRLVCQLETNPELAVLSILDITLKQATCALLAVHPEIGRIEDEPPVTSSARAIIDCASDLQVLLRRYRAALARERRCRDIPF